MKVSILVILLCLSDLLLCGLDDVQKRTGNLSLKEILTELKRFKEFYVEESLPTNLLDFSEFKRDDQTGIKIWSIEGIYSSIYELIIYVKENLLKY